MSLLDLTELLEMSEDDFRARFAGTPIMRAKRAGMQRNACVALGNLGPVLKENGPAVSALGRVLSGAEGRQGEPLVRSHAAWALGRIGGPEAAALLSEAAVTEIDPVVLEEIQSAFTEIRERIDNSTLPVRHPGESRNPGVL